MLKAKSQKSCKGSGPKYARQEALGSTQTMQREQPRIGPKAAEEQQFHDCDEDLSEAELKVQLAEVQAATAALRTGHPCGKSLEESAARIKHALHALKPIGAQIDGLRGVIDIARNRLSKAQAEVENAKEKIRVETSAIQMYTKQLEELETSMRSARGTL